MQSVSDRLYISIWNAISVKNFKQARKIIDKKLSKCPDHYLEALKLYLHGKTSSFAEKLSILAQLEELAGRDPFISNPDTIDLYEEILIETLPRSTEIWAKTIGELRWKCVKLSPSDENLCLHALMTCLSNDDLDHARQIVNVTEKKFSKNRNYVFWNITIMSLFALSDCYPNEKRNLCRSLALAQILKIADSTILSSAQGTLPLRSIQTPQEILLLHKIIDLSGSLEKSIVYLEDPKLGPESPIAKGGWELWRLKLKRLSQLKMWDELFKTAISLLERARTKNAMGKLLESSFSDWLVWDSLILSAAEFTDQTYMKRIKSELEAHLDPNSGVEKCWRRNASLAYVKFNFQTCIPFSNDTGKLKDNLFSLETIALIKYLYEYGDTYTVYDDLRPFLEVLRLSERIKFTNLLTSSVEPKDSECDDEHKKSLTLMIEKILSNDFSSSSGMLRASNNLKFKYLLTCSIPERKNYKNLLLEKPSLSPLKQIFGEAITLYKTAIKISNNVAHNLLKTDRHPIDDMALVASMCLVKIGLQEKRYEDEFLNNNKFSHILQAALILEFALTKSKHNFQILILLLRLYSYLGCGSLSMSIYQRLAIKQIQMDTLSYTFFDRISTFHPHPFENFPDEVTDTRSPAEHLRRQQKFYQEVTGQISANIKSSFQYGSYNSIFEMTEVSDSLKHSISAVSCLIEDRKISRLLAPSNYLEALPKNYEDIPLLSTPKLSDNNDYLTFPSFESSQSQSFHDICNFLAPPSVDRMKSLVLRDNIYQILLIHSDIKNSKYAIHRKWLERYYIQANTSTIDTDSMTRSEALAYDICHSLALITYISCESTCWLEEDFDRCLDRYNTNLLNAIESQRSLVSILKSYAIPSQITLHVLYTAYDVGNLCLEFHKYILSFQNTTHKSQIKNNEKILQEAVSLLSDVDQKAGKIRKSLNEAGWIDRVLNIFNDEVKETVNENFMEEWAGLVVESWRDSTIGLSYLKKQLP
ncbi:putative cytoskeleton organization protein [Erysiphe necator]|uniref:Putative cytoskeleton organization protein n=1 Tax=Uncinula necator TaxID=52586 RepID=A0A0B1P1M6_UNCNE|nr:putative cytoskeleton organization protein [Erysiphe necator]